MTFTLHVDGSAWRRHTASVRDQVRDAIRGPAGSPRFGDLVPVAKGNGYGMGITSVTQEAARLGLDRVAVGTVFEVEQVAEAFAGDILVLSPWDHRDEVASRLWRTIDDSEIGSRVVRTVCDIASAKRLTQDRPVPTRVVLEGITSMRRFGMLETDVLSLVGSQPFQNAVREGRIVLEGLALHLPLSTPAVRHEVGGLPGGTSARVVEVLAWAQTWRAAQEELDRARCPVSENVNSLWLSHLSDDELREVREHDRETALQARIGTRLWLPKDDGVLSARGTILAVHSIGKRFAVGYRQRKATSEGLVLVVGGGTSHGVAMSAPTPAASLRQRAVAAGTGALEATGRSRSPFQWGDKLLWFAEPPHMQVSMLWLPESHLRAGLAAGQRTPTVGDTLPCRVRHTTAAFDAIVSEP